MPFTSPKRVLSVEQQSLPCKSRKSLSHEKMCRLAFWAERAMLQRPWGQKVPEREQSREHSGGGR